MQCVFATLANPGGLPDTETEEETGPQTLPDTEKSSEAILLRAGVYLGSLGEKGEHGLDLTDWYKVDVVEGTVIRLRMDVLADPPFNLSLCWPLKHPAGNFVRVRFSGRDKGLCQELEYVTTHTGEYFIMISMPRTSPMPAGPYTLTIEITPP
jgi:hypothetical protein